MRLGTLKFESPLEHPDLLAEPVRVAIGPDSDAVGVSDTAVFCEQYGIGTEQAANCVLIEGKRGEDRILAAVVVLADSRADINGVVRAELNAKKASFAQMEKAVSETGMEFGAITPIGLPNKWPILIDRAVADSKYLIVGSGIRQSKIAVTGAFLTSLPNTRVVDGLAVKK